MAHDVPRRVLVVDDDPSVCLLVTRALTTRGWDVTIATSADEASAKLWDAEWDALLVDKHLPRVSGLTLAEQVRVTHPSVAIVLMTAQPSTIQRHGLLDGYLAKPFRSLDLVDEALRTACDRRARHQQMEALRTQLAAVSSSLTPPPIKDGV